MSRSASPASSSGLEPASSQVQRAPEAHQLLDHLVLLVHLDRVHAPVAAAEAVLADRAVEAAGQRAHPAVDDVREAHQERQTQTPALQVQDEVVHVYAGTFRPAGRGLDVPRLVDAEEAVGPAGDVVQLGRILDGPRAQIFQLGSPPACANGWWNGRRGQGRSRRHVTVHSAPGECESLDGRRGVFTPGRRAGAGARPVGAVRLSRRSARPAAAPPRAAGSRCRAARW